MSVSMKIMGFAWLKKDFFLMWYILLPCLEGWGLWLHNFRMIPQSVGYFLINRLKEDIAARLDWIKSNSCLSG